MHSAAPDQRLLEADRVEHQINARQQPRAEHTMQPRRDTAGRAASYATLLASREKSRATTVAKCASAFSSSSTSAGDAPFCGPNRRAAPSTPSNALSTSHAMSSGTSRSRTSSPLTSIRESRASAPPPGASSCPSASSNRAPSARKMPAPPSTVATAADTEHQPLRSIRQRRAQQFAGAKARSSRRAAFVGSKKREARRRRDIDDGGPVAEHCVTRRVRAPQRVSRRGFAKPSAPRAAHHLSRPITAVSDTQLDHFDARCRPLRARRNRRRRRKRRQAAFQSVRSGDELEHSAESESDRMPGNQPRGPLA